MEFYTVGSLLIMYEIKRIFDEILLLFEKVYWNNKKNVSILRFNTSDLNLFKGDDLPIISEITQRNEFI